MNKITKSLKNINWRLFVALLVMGLCPTIYTTIRTFFLGQFPGDLAYSIAGQLSWINLIYEVINEAIILPLFFLLQDNDNSRKELSNRINTGIIITFTIYFVLAIVISIFAEQLLQLMATSPSIIQDSVVYIRIESIANVFAILVSFCSVVLISLGKDKLVYILTIVKLLLCVVTDTFLVSSLSISANLGVNGIGISNIMVNVVLFVVSLLLLRKHGYRINNEEKLSFAWAKNLVKIGGISGIESFVRNIAYMLMVSRMVNMVGEQGTYWVANNFIWGWMLLPIIQLGELIKKETAEDIKAVKNNSLGYFSVTGIVCLLWVILIPTYKPFMKYVLAFDNVDKLFELVMVLFAFYILYAVQNVFDSTFYGRGKTNYMLFESVVTNSIYYGTFFVLYLTGVWVPTLIGIALMFGLGNLFDSVVSGIAYGYYLKKEKLNILDIE